MYYVCILRIQDTPDIKTQLLGSCDQKKLNFDAQFVTLVINFYEIAFGKAK